jgi:hypothetical protein
MPELAKYYGVNKSTIFFIIKKITYKDIQP